MGIMYKMLMLKITIKDVTQMQVNDCSSDKACDNMST